MLQGIKQGGPMKMYRVDLSGTCPRRREENCDGPSYGWSVEGIKNCLVIGCGEHIEAIAREIMSDSKPSQRVDVRKLVAFLQDV